MVRPRPVRDPELRLVVFHHAGGSSAAYVPLVRALPGDWELLLLDLPGRGRLHRAPPETDMAALVAAATAEVMAWTGPPVALFGHSLGAIVAAETARSLRACGVRPSWLGVSGRAAPVPRPGAEHPPAARPPQERDAPGRDAPERHGPGRDAQERHAQGRDAPGPGARVPLERLPLATMPDDELFDALAVLGGMPERLDELPEFRARFLRLVRADLLALASYRPDPCRAPLDVPITAFGSTGDPLAPPHAVDAWREETTAGFRSRTFPGGHFHLLGPALTGFGAALAQELRRSPTVPVPTSPGGTPS
ncbi:thioesterase II family protein [Actinomadura sp. WMMB 499]|uniref:thioesterase II family protein n=1 Tax=Actinomadura sp. WMMB 499 TaxID=1219491 RepID=UPI0020C7AC66|nr:alpha/beta fold hydrolase [Actinomadura sp. WMMB 499]